VSAIGSIGGGSKQQIVGEAESGLVSVSAASRKYQISGSVIDRWRQQPRQGTLQGSPQFPGEGAGTGEPWAQGEAGRAVSRDAQLEKLGDWLRQQRSANTSVITAHRLVPSPKTSTSWSWHRAVTTTSPKPILTGKSV